MLPLRNTPATILVIEDDANLASMLRDRFIARGYPVWLAANAVEAEQMADEIRPDLFILDLMLPDAHGLVLCANLREKHPGPIIICSGTKRREDPVLGFKLGATDFVAKPFSADELEARVEAALRRGPDTHPSSDRGVQTLGPLVIDQSTADVTLAGEPVHLTPTEYRLLSMLIGRPNALFSREELAADVWGSYDTGIARSLEVHVRRLRAKLRAGSSPAPLPMVVRGLGYKLSWNPDGEARHPNCASIRAQHSPSPGLLPTGRADGCLAP
jgi:DNA-binding response OmpR family regulator